MREFKKGAPIPPDKLHERVEELGFRHRVVTDQIEPCLDVLEGVMPVFRIQTDILHFAFRAEPGGMSITNQFPDDGNTVKTIISTVIDGENAPEDMPYPPPQVSAAVVIMDRSKVSMRTIIDFHRNTETAMSLAEQNLELLGKIL
jgi:hypothetical protein